MPALARRGVHKLLRTVDGRRHASEDDHDTIGPPGGARAGTQLHTPASSVSAASSRVVTKPTLMDDVDIDADPLSSDGEKIQASHQLVSPTSPPLEEVRKPGFKPPPQLDGPHEPPRVAAATFTRPRRGTDAKVAPPSSRFHLPNLPSSPPSAGSKRSAGESEIGSSDEDAMIFGSSQASQAKRQLTAATTTNIFAPPPAKKVAAYGSKVQRHRSREEEQKKATRIKKAKEAQAEKAKGPKFRQANIPSNMAAYQGRDTNTAFKQPGETVNVAKSDCDTGTDDYRADSPDLSDLSPPPASPLLEDMAPSALPSGVRRMECTICTATVPATMREDFEDLYPQAKQWAFKWQQRFCRHHRQAEASQLWEERGYPKIDWIRLASRLRQRKHMTHMKRIISGEVASPFREQFQTRVKSRAKTLLQVADDEDDAGKVASAGYYGPRGEKMMTDHILSSFADVLRLHATKDTLVAASGVSGGVSGYVQSVLVPQLAVSLIREDLGAKSDRDPLKVLEESAELGETLCPELESEIGDVDSAEADDGEIEEW
ncbi:hypothetical protein B0A54_09540 [Friedmanniomyces endolithicus]|uniref:Restriction of telomere capping protein 4 n=1 Tax=Friedmanniomyces endolithicus TaxID=329885 RepID=A0A4U0UU48_9PEZI|nr:hypothetical protein LTS09_005387 [Friedmanniomyces endolithicus]TKA38605.1 hypothetical protein B0A54_09540 [Friedmanniomyces endolithicus]